MSTAQRELEELRRAREAARLQAEEEKRIEDEKQKEREKKQAFLNRAAAFQQKKGPTDEEIKQKVQKESQKRHLSRKLNRLLKEDPGQNPHALELNLKGKAANYKGEYVSNSSDWELIEDPGQRPYYWNRVTHESTYDPPDETGRPLPPPPPPPRMLLVGLQQRPAEVVEEEEPVEEEGPVVEENQVEVIPQEYEAPKKSAWVYVVENEPNPYYWNTETNETSFEPPEGYDGAIFGQTNPVVAETTVGTEVEENISFHNKIIWEERVNEAGEVFYFNAADDIESLERPEGQLVVVVVDEEGNEVNWQEYYDQDNDTIQYLNLITGEVSYEKPIGITLVLQQLI